VPAQYTDEEVSSIQEKIAAMVEKAEGKIVRNENLGKIKLAYPIQKVSHGSYILVYFDADGGTLAELNRLLGLSDEVLRHTIVERPEGVEDAKFEISSYVAPLSDEGRRTQQKQKTERPKVVKKPEPEKIMPPPPAEKTTEESKMTMQELDQQLDKILEGDIGENI